jgi:1-deoxy-D-xylulose-5-phosphate synthase
MAEQFNLLSKVNNPQDLKTLSKSELPQLCEELRQFIIQEVASNPGHLGASLGTIELTVALHYVMDTPNDKLIWDVGHQAYGHKILTERRDKFSTNRKFGGLSGFPTKEESKYDAFGTGHSSTSISAALGMAIASQLKGEDRQFVAIIGDGALTGGMAYEALNNAASSPNNLLIILNDNQMSISANVGGMSNYLLDIATSQTYNKFRTEFATGLEKVVGKERRDVLSKMNTSIKAMLSKQGNIFEGLKIRYFGITDGHDVLHLVEMLEDLKKIKGPKVLHCRTKKGKGYAPAEEAQTLWHAPGLFDKETGLYALYGRKNA